MGSTDLNEWKDVTKGSLFNNAEVYYIFLTQIWFGESNK